MKKLLSLALTLMAATVLPASAMALDTQDVFQVRILTARSEIDVGSWYFTLDESNPMYCNYAVEWESAAGLISTDCVFNEWKAHGRRSCLRNAVDNFPTLVQLDDQCECDGFSDLGLLEQVDALTLGEGWNRLDGLIMLSGPTGTVHSIIARGT